MNQRMFNDLYSAMPWDKIDTVVFDIGNVLLSYHPEQMLREAYPDDPAMQRRMLPIFGLPYWIMLDRGTANRAKFAQLASRGDEALRRDIEALLARLCAFKYPVPEGVAILRACKARGKRTLALSNYGAESYADISARHDYFGLLDGALISAHEGVLKPEREIYALLIERYHLDPARTLFLDDAPANVEGALFAGLQSLLFDPATTPAFFGL